MWKGGKFHETKMHQYSPLRKQNRKKNAAPNPWANRGIWRVIWRLPPRRAKQFPQLSLFPVETGQGEREERGGDVESQKQGRSLGKRERFCLLIHLELTCLNMGRHGLILFFFDSGMALFNSAERKTGRVGVVFGEAAASNTRRRARRGQQGQPWEANFRAMDLLKGELQRKRNATADSFAGKCFVRRSELEQRQLQKRREEHRIKLLSKARQPARSSAASGPSEPGAAAGEPSPNFPTGAAANSLTPAPDLPREEVVRRLRVLSQPITLFGEDDVARVERLKLVLRYGLVHEIDDLDMVEGQTNEFLRDIVETRKRRKVTAGRYTNTKGRRVGGGAGGISADEDEGDGDDDDLKRMNANFEELCEEDRILVFFKRLLNEWKQELDAMTELEKGTANGKLVLATFNQRARDLDPLFHLCRKKVRAHHLTYLLAEFGLGYCQSRLTVL